MLARRVPLRRNVPSRRGEPPKRFVGVQKKRSRPRRGPERCADYLAWIRTLPCILCGTSAGVEAGHTNALGPRGLGQKASDFSAIPLCADHHRKLPSSYHRLGEERFSGAHRIYLSEVVAALNFGYFQHARMPSQMGDCPT